MTGSDAVTMVKQAGQIDLGKTRKIFGPVIADETMAAGVGPSSIGVQSGVRYHFTVENAANKVFVEAFRKKYNEYPSAAAGEAYDGIPRLKPMITVDMAMIRQPAQGSNTWSGGKTRTISMT